MKLPTVPFRIYEKPLQSLVTVYTTTHMQIEFDLSKDALNIAKHGVSLGRTSELQILAAVENTREGDGERRFRLYGWLDGEAYCAIVTYRGAIVRAISLRKANRSERSNYYDYHGKEEEGA